MHKETKFLHLKFTIFVLISNFVAMYIYRCTMVCHFKFLLKISKCIFRGFHDSNKNLVIPPKNWLYSSNHVERRVRDCGSSILRSARPCRPAMLCVQWCCWPAMARLRAQVMFCSFLFSFFILNEINHFKNSKRRAKHIKF